MHEVSLPGCTPEPLMGYLKALGVFRLVAEQADPTATLCWKSGIACLTSKLDRDGLVGFFRDEYRPTPIMTPWNSASGFAPTKASNKAPKDKAAREAVSRIHLSNEPRFEEYRRAIDCIRDLPRGDDSAESWKQDYVTRCRASLPDSIVEWLDTCFALTNESLPPFPLLGSGGNDGVTDFGSLFMQRLKDVLIEPPKGSSSEEFLRDSLFSGLDTEGRSINDCPPTLLQDTVGQFNPRGIGGANATQGRFESSSEVNPWDFVVMIEGMMFLAGAVTRRMGSNRDKAVFPFTVESIIVGAGSTCEKEARIHGKEPPNSGELWLPLWKQSVPFLELKHLFAEGRAQLGRRQARNSVEFALSVCTLGIDRGIESFARYGFLRRSGKSFLATPLGRIKVEPRPKSQVLNDPSLISWLDDLRDACRENDGKKEKVPARYKVALRGIDRAMFEFANRSEMSDNPSYLINVLRAVGRAERVIATEGLSFFKDKKYGWRISPLQRLNPEWLEQIDDLEIRIAASLAGIQSVSKKGAMIVGPLRHHLEPVVGDRYVDWTKNNDLKSNSAVWSKQPLSANLAAVFRRRQMEAFRGGVKGVPMSSPRPARLDDVLAFLHGKTDDEKLGDLIWALTAINWRKVTWVKPERSDGSAPVEFGLPRLLVNPRFYTADRRNSNRPRWTIDKGKANAIHDQDVFHALASGKIDVAITKAARRLRSGGLIVNGYRNRRQAGSDLTATKIYDAERLLAAMLIPISSHDLVRIANTVLYHPELED